jgi:threonine/homoserine/homoserine lactone efflux protein
MNMELFWSECIIVATIHVLSLISPGPDFLMIVKNTTRYGRHTGLWTGVGIAMGESIHAGYSILGLGLIMSKSVVIMSVIKYLGGGYLFYIGAKSLWGQREVFLLKNKTSLSYPGVAPSDSQPSSSGFAEIPIAELTPLQAVRQGFFTNVLNPKAALFTIGLFTIVVSPHTPIWLQIAYALFIVFSTLAWFALVSFFLSAEPIKSSFGRAKQWIELTTGSILVLLGAKLSVSDLFPLKDLDSLVP